MNLRSQPLLAALGLAALSLTATAQQRLLVGTPSGSLYSADPQVDAFELELNVGEPIHAIAQVGNRVYLGSPSGAIRSWNPLTGAVTLAMTVPNDVTDLVPYKTDLLVSGSDGTVLRVNPRQGVIDETFTSSFDIQALAVDGDVLFAGTPFGVFQKIDLSQSEGFVFAGVCGGPINSMVLTDAEMYLGDQTGQVYVYDKATEFVTYAYPVDNDATGIVQDGDEFLIGGSNGTIRRVTQIVGTLVDTLNAPEAVLDIAFETPLIGLAQAVDTVSIAAGGTIDFDLTAPTQTAGDTYLLLGSASGATPGITSNGVHLALNVDGYFQLTLPPFGDDTLTGGFGTFDVDGAAQASFTLPAGLDPSLAGISLHHAYVTWDSLDPSTLLGASNPVKLTLAP